MDTTLLDSFDIKDVYFKCLERNEKGKVAVDDSLENHYYVVIQLAKDYFHALEILELLQDHIEHRLKLYTKCISKSTPNYFKFLMETYNRQLRQKFRANLEDE